MDWGLLTLSPIEVSNAKNHVKVPREDKEQGGEGSFARAELNHLQDGEAVPSLKMQSYFRAPTG